MQLNNSDLREVARKIREAMQKAAQQRTIELDTVATFLELVAADDRKTRIQKALKESGKYEDEVEVIH